MMMPAWAMPFFFDEVLPTRTDLFSESEAAGFLADATTGIATSDTAASEAAILARFIGNSLSYLMMNLVRGIHCSTRLCG